MKMHLPNTLEELKTYLKDADDNTYILSGGTDLILKLCEEITENFELIDISQIEELKGISEDGEDVVIGAMTRLSEVVENPIIAKWAPLLACAADQVGSTQIRNSATIGGNVANAFAGADTIPPLKALDATVIIMDNKGSKREEQLVDFTVGNRKNTLKNDEVLIEIRFKKQEHTGYFHKIGSRSRVTISKLNMAIVLRCVDGTIEKASVFAGALGTVAFRSTMLEEYLVGKEIIALKEEEILSVLVEQVDTAIPTRSSRHYKREAIQAIGHGLLKLLREECEVSCGA